MNMYLNTTCRFLFFAICLVTILHLCNSASLGVENKAGDLKKASQANSTITKKAGVTVAEYNETITQHEPPSDHKITDYINNNMPMLKRGFYVLLAVTVIIALYFGVRVYRTRNKKVKKYGLLNNSGGETIGLHPIDSDSDDDYTVFETKTIR